MDSNATIDAGQWADVEIVIDRILDGDEEKAGEGGGVQVEEPLEYDSSEDLLEAVDGYMIPRKLSRYMRTTSVEIAPGYDLDLNLEEQMMEDLHHAMASDISSPVPPEGWTYAPRAERDDGQTQELALRELMQADLSSDEEEVTLVRPVSALHQREDSGAKASSSGSPSLSPARRSPSRPHSRLPSRPSSRPASHLSGQKAGSRRTSSTVGGAPSWLVYHWLSPKETELCEASTRLLQICKVSTALSETIFVKNLALSHALCQAIPVTESEELAKHLLRVMEAAKISINLLEIMIKDEVAHTRKSPPLYSSQ